MRILFKFFIIVNIILKYTREIDAPYDCEFSDSKIDYVAISIDSRSVGATSLRGVKNGESKILDFLKCPSFEVSPDVEEKILDYIINDAILMQETSAIPVIPEPDSEKSEGANFVLSSREPFAIPFIPEADGDENKDAKFSSSSQETFAIPVILEAIGEKNEGVNFSNPVPSAIPVTSNEDAQKSEKLEIHDFYKKYGDTYFFAKGVNHQGYNLKTEDKKHSTSNKR